MNEVDSCLRHRRMTQDQARATAAALRARSQRYRGLVAWPCKIGGERHWHVGRGRRR